MLEKTTRMNQLYDFYQSLLTEKQRTYMELYYYDDLSLGEIAEQANVSRQAVFEHLKRSEQLLELYESQLHIVARNDQQTHLLNKLAKMFEDEQAVDKQKALRMIEQLKNVD